MLRRTGLLGLLALTMVGCSPDKGEGALLALVTLETKVRASCVVVEAGPPGGAALKSVRIEASDAKREYRVAVTRGDLPADIGLRARALWGAGCAEAAVETGASDEQRSNFPIGEVRTIALGIAAPPATSDADGDGFVTAGSGGLDCDDQDAAVNPAAQEACAGLVDLNCNDLAGCADPVCAGLSCAAAGSALAFLTPALTLPVGQCSAEVAIEVRNGAGLAAPVAADTTVGFTALPAVGFGFYSDPACTVVADTVTIPRRSAQAKVYLRGQVAGSVAVSASSGTLTPVTQTETILPGAAVALAFVTPARTVAAGACSAALTLESQDAFGNGADVTALATVTLTATPALGVGFFRQPDCTGAAAGLGIAAGSRRVTFYFRATANGTVSVTAESAPLTPVSQAQTVTPATASVLAFTTPARTAVAGTCSGVLTLESRDGFGNIAPVAAATAISLTGAPAGSFTWFTDSTCSGSGVGQVTLAAGQSLVSFYFKGQVNGVGSVTASGGGFSSANQAATITAAAASALGFVTAAQGIQVAQCSGITTIRSQDAFGNAANVAATTAVSLTANPSSGFGFYSDPGCTTAITSVNLEPTGPTASFYFKGTAPVVHTISAQAAGFPYVSQQETLGVGPPTQLAFTTAAHNLPVGQCSGVLTLQARDVASNPSNVTGNKTVNLAANPATGVFFFADAACTGAAVTSVTMLGGSASSSFYFKGTQAGPVDLTASAAGLSPATQGQTLTVGAPNKLVFGSGAQSLVAGECSGLASLSVTDAFGNVSAVAGGATLALSAAPATDFLFYSDSGCTAQVASTSVAPGGSTAGFYFKGTLSGPVGVTVDGTSASLGTVQQTQTIGATSVAELAITSPPRSASAGNCSGVVTVQTRDIFHNLANAAASTTVDLTSSSGTMLFYSDAGCTAAVTSRVIASGANAQSFYFKDTEAGPPTITVTATGLGPDTQAQTITAATASRLVFTSSVQAVKAGACSAAVTFVTRDAYGNLANASANTTVNLELVTPGTMLFFSDGACASQVTTRVVGTGTSTQTFFFKDTWVGGPTLRITAASFTEDTQATTIEAAAADTLAFSSAAVTVAAGSCSTPLTVQTRDAYGNVSNVLAPTSVGLSSLSGSLGFFSDPTCDAGSQIASREIASGTSAQSFYLRDTAVGAPFIYADATSFTQGEQQESIGPGSPHTLAFATAPQTVRAGQCSGALNARSRDEWGNASPVTSTTTLALAAAPDAGFAFYSNFTCTAPVSSVDIPNGSSNAPSVYFKGTVAQDLTVSASNGAFTNDATQPASVRPAAPAGLVFTSAAQTLAAGVCSSEVTLEARDSFDNTAPVAAGAPVALTMDGGLTFYADGGCGAPAITSVDFAPDAGSTSFWFKASSVPNATVIATASFGAASQTQSVSPGAAFRLFIATDPLHATTTLCSGPVTIQTLDEFYNLTNVTSPTTIDLTEDSAQAFTFHTSAACPGGIPSVNITPGNNSASFYIKGTNTSGVLPVTVTATHSTGVLLPAEQLETISAGPDTLVFTSSPQTLHAGRCSGLVTLEARDATGLPTAVVSNTNVALTGSAGITFFSDAACTVSSAIAQIPALGATTGFYFKSLSAGALQVTGTASFANDTQGVTVIGVVQAGTCTLAGGTSSTTCAIPAPLSNLSNAFLIFQAKSNNEDSPRRTFVRCRLQDVSTIACSRNSTNGTVNINWQTADLPAITVQHLSAGCTGPTTDVTITAVSNTAQTFVLHSYSSDNGTIGASDLHTVRLTSTTNVELRQSAGSCAASPQHYLQVVEFPGATVTRGNAVTLASGNGSVAKGGLPGVVLARTALLYSWRMVPGNTELCRKMLRGEMTANNTITFTRGDSSGSCNGDAVDDIAWERIQLPNTGMTVQQVTNSIGNSVATFDDSITAVDPTRTLAFTGAQVFAGQGIGETAVIGNNDLGPAIGGHVLTTTTNLRISRDDTTSSVRWTSFVMQLVP